LFAYGPADATAIPVPHRILRHLNPDWFYLSGRAALSIWWALRTSPCLGPNPSVDRRFRWMRRAPGWQGAPTKFFFACWPSGAPCQPGALRTSVSCLPVNAALLSGAGLPGLSWKKGGETGVCLWLQARSHQDWTRQRTIDTRKRVAMATKSVGRIAAMAVAGFGGRRQTSCRS